MDQTLKICRMVHYRSYGTPGGEYTSVCRAAVVSGVRRLVDPQERHAIDVMVINPTGLFFNTVEHGFEGGQWHWPGECPDGA